MENIVLTISGMTCQGCANGVKKALELVDGVDQASVTLTPPRAEVIYDADRTTPAALREAIEGAGFDVTE